ncbi:MAG: hypothetical protein WBM53_11295 [Maribacter sp.]
MKPLLMLCLLFMGCNQPPEVRTLEKENQRLQKKVDSLKNELHKCEMLMKAYENEPLSI